LDKKENKGVFCRTGRRKMKHQTNVLTTRKAGESGGRAVSEDTG